MAVLSKHLWLCHVIYDVIKGTDIWRGIAQGAMENKVSRKYRGEIMALIIYKSEGKYLNW